MAVEVLDKDEGDDFADMLRETENLDGDKGTLELRAYDADLVYCNGHILSTESVVGQSGDRRLASIPIQDAHPAERSCSTSCLWSTTSVSTVTVFAAGTTAKTALAWPATPRAGTRLPRPLDL